jgi:hypothetical protein
MTTCGVRAGWIGWGSFSVGRVLRAPGRLGIGGGIWAVGSSDCSWLACGGVSRSFLITVRARLNSLSLSILDALSMPCITPIS